MALPKTDRGNSRFLSEVESLVSYENDKFIYLGSGGSASSFFLISGAALESGASSRYFV